MAEWQEDSTAQADALERCKCILAILLPALVTCRDVRHAVTSSQLPVIAFGRHSFGDQRKERHQHQHQHQHQLQQEHQQQQHPSQHDWISGFWAKPFFYFRSALWEIQKDGSKLLLSDCCNRKHKTFGQNVIGAVLKEVEWSRMDHVRFHC